MAFENLLKPITINQMALKNRMVMPSMGTNFSNPDHTVSDRLFHYIETRAKGGIGFIMMEYSCVDESGLSAPYQLGIFDDAQIPGLARLAEAAHKYGAKIGMQIQHGGVQAIPAEGQAMGPSAVKDAREMTKEDIQQIVEAFAKAAGRAKKAGMDAVEIHGAHGYLVNQFMSPYYNKRMDEYGGSLENRLRFPLEVYRAVRAEVGDDFVVNFRLSGEEHIEGGCSTEDKIAMAKALAEAGVDAIHVAAGLIESAPWVIAPGSTEEGYNVSMAEAIKKSVDIPVIVVGKLHNPEYAESILSEGIADLVALGRAMIVDPEYPNKVAEGRTDEIKRCIYCIQHCLDIPAACVQNPDFGHEGEHDYSKAAEEKTVAVIGGGAAGLEAAMTAARRGHKVTLFEKENELGGLIRIASVPPHKEALFQVVSYRTKQIEKLGVDIKLNTEVSVDILKELNPDAVIVATGSIPLRPPIKGIDDVNSVTADNILNGSAAAGEKVLVIGGGSVGLETAEFLMEKGKKVTVVEMMDTVAKDMAHSVKVTLMERIEGKIEIRTSTAVKEFSPEYILVEHEETPEKLTGFDTVVLALGYRGNDTLSASVKEALPEAEVFVVGDAKNPRARTIWEAVGEGCEAGRTL